MNRGGDARGGSADLDLVRRAKAAIEQRNLIDWRGLPPQARPEPLFGVTPDGNWGEARLGEARILARRRILEIEGYYRPTLYCRDRGIALFEGTNPRLIHTWPELQAGLGRPDRVIGWCHDGFDLPDGEHVYARRGIAFRVNPANDFVIHVLLFAPTTIDDYLERLRPPPPPILNYEPPP